MSVVATQIECACGAQPQCQHDDTARAQSPYTWRDVDESVPRTGWQYAGRFVRRTQACALCHKSVKYVHQLEQQQQRHLLVCSRCAEHLIAGGQCVGGGVSPSACYSISYALTRGAAWRRIGEHTYRKRFCQNSIVSRRCFNSKKAVLVSVSSGAAGGVRVQWCTVDNVNVVVDYNNTTFPTPADFAAAAAAAGLTE
jgi:hypothetical protein